MSTSSFTLINFEKKAKNEKLVHKLLVTVFIGHFCNISVFATETTMLLQEDLKHTPLSKNIAHENMKGK